MINLQEFELVDDEECQGFRLKEQEVVPKKTDLSRVGVIRQFLRSKKDPTIFAALLKWTFLESGTVGANYQLLSELEPRDAQLSEEGT